MKKLIIPAVALVFLAAALIASPILGKTLNRMRNIAPAFNSNCCPVNSSVDAAGLSGGCAAQAPIASAEVRDPRGNPDPSEESSVPDCCD